MGGQDRRAAEHWRDRSPPWLHDLFEENFMRNESDRRGTGEQPVRWVTAMDMPASRYRAMLQCEIDMEKLARGTAMPGFRHQHQDFIGRIASITPEQRRRWLKMMHDTVLRAA
jgi:hypothetical protein